MHGFVVALLLFLSVLPANSAQACERPWLFFDLGDVLVDTSDWSRLRHMPGARNYLRRLGGAGYVISLIVNVPEEWGTTRAQKVQTLREVIAKSWAEPVPFAWEFARLILVPPTNKQRKPDLYLFKEALAAAAPCPAIYQGEDPRETTAAIAAGLKAFTVGKSDPSSFFLPVERIPEFVSAP